MANGLKAAYAEDIRMRTVEERLPIGGTDFDAHEFESDTTVFDEGGVRVDAFVVDHGGELRPAYGFRVMYAGRSVVISGDTRYSENLIRHAAGADVILHEVAVASPEARSLPSLQFRIAHHTSPTDAARVFQQIKPRLAVFSHLAFLPDQQGQLATAADLIAEASKGYTGRMEVGEDLMRIVVGDSIDVQRRERR
jgi:ribonuclease Z